jgi:hypothetical protein
MKPSSAKQKGRLLQQYVRDALYRYYPELEEGDVRSTSMGAGGSDVLLSPFAKRTVGSFSIECKSLASFVGFTYYDQARSHKERVTDIPIAVVKKNGRQPLVLIDLDDFLKLLRSKDNEKTD